VMAGMQLRDSAGDSSGAEADGWMAPAAARVDNALKLPWQAPVESLDAAWRYRFLGQLGTQVRQGCPGWLFYADGLRAPDGDLDAAFAARVGIMQTLVQQLRDRGVQLLVVTVPDKSRIAGQHLCGLSRPAATVAQLPRFVQTLDAAGVPHVALDKALAAMPGDAYYRTDVHLNQAGALWAAQAVADIARPMLGGNGEQHYQVETEAAAKPRMGDLVVLAGLENAPDGWRPALDIEVPEAVSMQASGGLLDDGPEATVLLAGSSNSRRSNFAEQLGRLLQQPVLNQSQDGGKFADALMQSIGDSAQWPGSMQLVIWELSEMSLLQPLSPAERKAAGIEAGAATLPAHGGAHAGLSSSGY